MKTTKDMSKLEMLYIQYRSDMLREARSILHDEYEAEDCVHESILKASKYIDMFAHKPCDKSRNLMIIITRSCSIDRYRKRQKSNEVEYDEEMFTDKVSFADCRDRVIEKYEYQELVASIRQLPRTYADVMELVYLYELPIDSACELLKISKDNIYVRISRAKKMLLARLESKKEENRHE